MKSWLLLLTLGLVQAQSLPSADLNLLPPMDTTMDVRLEELTQLIDKADRLVVRDWNDGPSHERDKLLYESNKRADLDALKLALKLEVPESWMHCMCLGSVEVSFYAGDTKLGDFTNQHSSMIRCSLWHSDVPLADPEPLLKWFDERKIDGPRGELEASREEQERFEAAEKKWLAAMPAPLVPLWSAAAEGEPGQPDLAPFRKALEQIEDRNARVLALLHWYGSGVGPWSGYYSYENVAGELLLDYSTAVLNAIGSSMDLTSVQLEGLVRLLAGWEFPRRRPDDLALVSPALKARLLAHALANDDEDRCRRVWACFGDVSDFDALAGPRPMAALVQTDPWAMVLGADSPRVVVYQNGRVVRAKPTPERMTYRTFILDEAGLDRVREALQPVFGLANLKPHYDLAPGVTDQPETRIYLCDQDFAGSMSVYGLEVGEAPSAAASATSPPKELLDLITWLSKLDSDRSEEWVPDFVEVMLWDYSQAPDASIQWPDDWPSLASNHAVKRGDAWSIFLDASELPRLRELLATRPARGALEIDGRKLAVSWRYAFPGEPAWRIAFETPNPDPVPKAR